MSFKIEITEIDDSGKQSFFYHHEVSDLDVMAIHSIVTRKPRAPRKDAGVPRKKEPAEIGASMASVVFGGK